MLKLSVNQEMMLRIVAHHILNMTDWYDGGCNGVDAGVLEMNFPDRKSWRSVRAPLVGAILADGEYNEQLTNKGVLIVSGERVWDSWNSHYTNEVDLDAITVSKLGAQYLVERGFVPAQHIGALVSGIESEEETGDSGFSREQVEGFDEWLATGWQDPTGFVHQPGAKEAKGAVGVNSATKWVRKLTYTPAEAAAEHARIESGALTTLSKRAYKAHVTRRIVEAA